MRHVLILGAGTAGTMMANKLRKALPLAEWAITVLDRDTDHVYQPGLLFLPFGLYDESDLVRPRSFFLSAGIDLRIEPVDRVVPAERHVLLEDGTVLGYDVLIVATGTRIAPEATEGLAGPGWMETAFDFYTVEGAAALRTKLDSWTGGRLVLNVVDMPIKCPVAPLEFLFLADHFFQEKGIRDQVELVYATPLDGAFTKPRASAALGDLLKKKGVLLETEFNTATVDGESGLLIGYDEREVPYDLLVTVPVNMGADYVERSGLGDELNHVEVDKFTFLADDSDNIFAIGDASNIPTSKAGSVAHFAVDVFVDNFLQHIKGQPMTGAFDGHANCFIESGHGKGMLIDFNYDVEPLPGKYPLPGVGPFSLLKETEANHWGKLMFKWTYWNMLLPGREMPLPNSMSMSGKIPAEVSS